MILTEDDLQQVLRRRSLQRERLLPREGDRLRWGLSDVVTAVFMGLVLALVSCVYWGVL